MFMYEIKLIQNVYNILLRRSTSCMSMQREKNLKRIMVRDGICGESANVLKNGCRRWSVWVGQAGRSENCRRHFKLILCCFWSIISPHTKFRPNPMKNAVVENIHYWS